MADIVWNYFVELRKELLEAQRIRAQVIGFKFAFITTSMSLMVANVDKLNNVIFVLPAFAAIFFDFIIYSYSFSIKRIGCYVRDHIEPVLVQSDDLPSDFVMWQKFLTQPKTRQNLAHYGNIGVTMLAAAIGVIGLILSFDPIPSSCLLLALSAFIVMDLLAFREPQKLGKLWVDNDFIPARSPDLTNG